MGLLQLEHERFAWSQKQFPETTATSSLQHLKKEITEIEESIKSGTPDIYEFADALMLILDSAGRCNFGPGQLLDAFRTKLDINKSRNWDKNEDNSYSHIEDLAKPKTLEDAADELKENTKVDRDDSETLKRAVILCQNHQNTSPTFIQSQLGTTLEEGEILSKMVEAILFTEKAEKAHKTIKLKPDPVSGGTGILPDEFTDPVKTAKKKLDKKNDFMD